MSTTRPVLRYMGGKWRLASWIVRPDGARPRIEALWISPAAEEALRQRAAGQCSPLFAGAV